MQLIFNVERSYLSKVVFELNEIQTQELNLFCNEYKEDFDESPTSNEIYEFLTYTFEPIEDEVMDDHGDLISFAEENNLSFKKKH